MIKVNIHEAKAKLSHYLKLAQSGERVWLCKHNVPVAELTPLQGKSKKKRKLGVARGDIVIKGDIVNPWSDEEIEEWFTNDLPEPK